MTKRERRFLPWFLAGLCVWAALGAYGVLAQSDATRVAAFADRFENFASLGLTPPPTVSLKVEKNRLTAEWPEGTPRIDIRSARQPLPAGTAHVQADIYIGGTQNTAVGGERYGFRAYLTLYLWRGDACVAATSLETPLASSLGRQRLYSLRADAAARDGGADGYTVGWVVEPIGNALPQGSLTCGWLEVLH